MVLVIGNWMYVCLNISQNTGGDAGGFSNVDVLTSAICGSGGTSDFGKVWPVVYPVLQLFKFAYSSLVSMPLMWLAACQLGKLHRAVAHQLSLK